MPARQVDSPDRLNCPVPSPANDLLQKLLCNGRKRSAVLYAASRRSSRALYERSAWTPPLLASTKLVIVECRRPDYAGVGIGSGVGKLVLTMYAVGRVVPANLDTRPLLARERSRVCDPHPSVGYRSSASHSTRPYEGVRLDVSMRSRYGRCSPTVGSFSVPSPFLRPYVKTSPSEPSTRAGWSRLSSTHLRTNVPEGSIQAFSLCIMLSSPSFVYFRSWFRVRSSEYFLLSSVGGRVRRCPALGLSEQLSSAFSDVPQGLRHLQPSEAGHPEKLIPNVLHITPPIVV